GDLAAVVKAHLRLARVEVVDRRVLNLEENLAASGEARGDQVLDHLVLRINHDRSPAGQAGKVDAVRAAAEAQIDAVVHEAFALHALADAGRLQQVDGALLEHAGADRRPDLLAAAQLEHHGVDSLQVQQVRKQEPRRSGADDANSRAHQSTVHAAISMTVPGH